MWNENITIKIKIYYKISLLKIYPFFNIYSIFYISWNIFLFIFNIIHILIQKLQIYFLLKFNISNFLVLTIHLNHHKKLYQYYYIFLAYYKKYHYYFHHLLHFLGFLYYHHYHIHYLFYSYFYYYYIQIDTSKNH